MKTKESIKKATDPVCTITAPRNDEISIINITDYPDRWFLGFMDVWDIEKNKKVGEIMYESSGSNNFFILKPWKRISPDSFSPNPAISKYSTRFGGELPDVVDLLNPSEKVIGLIASTQTSDISFGGIVTTITRPNLLIHAYSSWKGCAKARAEYFMRNRDFLKLDPAINADKFFMDMVHQPPIERDADYNPNTFHTKATDGKDVDPIATIGKMCESLEKSGQEWK